MARIQANSKARWNKFSTPLMATLNCTKKPLRTRARGRMVKSLYDWMAHAYNLAKGSKSETKEQDSACVMCGGCETQAHINTSCTHPSLVDLRLTYRRKIEVLLYSFQHQNLPIAQRWIRLFIDYVETHMWEDSELAGDIWNGRWHRNTISDLLGILGDAIPASHDLSAAIQWLTSLTCLLQKTQQALYTLRGHILHKTAKQLKAAERRQKNSKGGAIQATLQDLWGIKYVRKPLATLPSTVPTLAIPDQPIVTVSAIQFFFLYKSS